MNSGNNLNQQQLRYSNVYKRTNNLNDQTDANMAIHSQRQQENNFGGNTNQIFQMQSSEQHQSN